MTSFTDRHGKTFTVQLGAASSFCSHCREMFNSASAFDRHLKSVKGKPAKHLDPAEIGMERNSRGLWVTALRSADSPSTPRYESKGAASLST